ncbi:Paf1 complex component [Umbelopsis nana]
MDDLFGSDDDQQSELNDTPSPQDIPSHSHNRVSAEENVPNSESNQAGLDDLFGSDDDNEADDDAASVRKRRVVPLPGHSESEQDEDDRERGYEQDDFDNQEDDERISKRQRIEVELTMPELPLPVSKDGKFHLAKLPKFLNIEPMPFSPETYDSSLAQNVGDMTQQELVRRQVESTIRWRKVVDERGKLVPESNARLVEWEDGTMSLVLGSEYFDVNVKPMSNEEHHYLLAHQTSSGILESHLKFTNNMSFRPSDLKSDTHRNLTAQIADKHVRKTRTKMFMTEQDPERVKQEAEMREQERLRAKRKLDSSRRRAEDRYAYDRPVRYEYGAEDEEEVERYGGRDEYDEDFVVDDEIVEEEEEEKERQREERLAKLKKSGMDRYRQKRRNDDHDEDEEEEEEEEDESEADEGDLTPEEEDRVSSRKVKRRQVLSDEEDE